MFRYLLKQYHPDETLGYYLVLLKLTQNANQVSNQVLFVTPAAYVRFVLY